MHSRLLRRHSCELSGQVVIDSTNNKDYLTCNATLDHDVGCL